VVSSSLKEFAMSRTIRWKCFKNQLIALIDALKKKEKVFS